MGDSLDRSLGKWIVVAALAGLATACDGSSNGRPDFGYRSIARLKVGDTRADVSAMLGKGSEFSFGWPRDYVLFAVSEPCPPKLLLSLPEGTAMVRYSYRVHSSDAREFAIFYSSDDRLIGWVTDIDDARDAELNRERLVSRLKRGMSREQVLGTLGRPLAVAPTPSAKDRTRMLYGDMYWSIDPVAVKTPDSEMWRYEYPIGDGASRNVYLLWNRKLVGWGYSAAYDRPERKAGP